MIPFMSELARIFGFQPSEGEKIPIQIQRSFACKLAKYPSRLELAEKMNRCSTTPMQVHVSGKEPVAVAVSGVSAIADTPDSPDNFAREKMRREIEKRLWSFFGTAAQDESSLNLSGEEIDKFIDNFKNGRIASAPIKNTVSASREAEPHKCAQFGRISCPAVEIEEPESGHIKDLGKFLLDPEAVTLFERVLASKKSSWLLNSLSCEHAVALRRLQDYLVKQSYAHATVVIAPDGNLLSHTGIENQNELETMSSWAYCAYINSKVAAGLIGSKHLKNLVLRSESSVLTISDFGRFLLVTVSSQDECEAELLKKLEELLA